MQIRAYIPINAQFAYINVQFHIACNTLNHCLHVSNLLGKFHGDFYYVILFIVFNPFIYIGENDKMCDKYGKATPMDELSYINLLILIL